MTTIDRDAVLAELDERLRIVRGALDGAVTEDTIRVVSAVRIALELTKANLAALPTNNDEVERLVGAALRWRTSRYMSDPAALQEAELALFAAVDRIEPDELTSTRALIQPNS